MLAGGNAVSAGIDMCAGNRGGAMQYTTDRSHVQASYTTKKLSIVEEGEPFLIRERKKMITFLKPQQKLF